MGLEGRAWASLRFFAISALLLLASCAAHSAEAVVKREPAAVWADQAPLPQYDPARPANNLYGTAWLLVDYVVHHTPGGYATFRRSAFKIIDRVGLEEDAKFQISFDPSYQSAAINSVTVTRNGVKRELRGEVIVNTYRSEKDDYLGILTGRLTANVLIPNVQVGDVVDYAFTVESGGSLGSGFFDDLLPVEYETSTRLLRRKIIWPSSQPLRVRRHGSAPSPQISESDGFKSYLWEIRDYKPAKVESSLPNGILDLSSVEVSSVQSWGDLVRALLPHYQPESNLPADFRARLDGIAQKWPLKPDRLTEALRLVEDEVRYVSLSIGEGALIPRRPHEVLRTGFGDCKDKSLLLVSALQYLGIDSGLALARLYGNEILKERLPALGAFDHAVAFARLEGKTVWMDPTDSQQGGRGFLIVEPDYGYALPLERGSQSLVKMSGATMLLPNVVTREEFVLPVKGDDPLLLTVFSTFLKGEADSYRKRIANEGLDSVAAKYLDYYAGRFPRMEAREKLEIKDNREANVLTVIEKYVLKDPKLAESGLGRAFPVKGDIGLPGTDDFKVEGRLKPYNAGRPFARRHIANFKNLKAVFRGPDPVKNDGKWFDYFVGSTATSTELTIEWQLLGKAGIIPAAELKGYSEAIQQIWDSSNREYDFLYDENAGTEQTRYEKLKEYLALTFAAIGLLFVLRRLLQIYVPSGDTLFLPVGLPKFFVMYNLTGGLYAIYWAWMSIRHHRGRKRFDLIAFVSGVFFPLASLFMAWRVRRLFPECRRLATLVLVLLSAFSAYYLYENYRGFFLDDPKRTLSLNLALILGQSVVLLPLLRLINRANVQAHATESKYRTFSEWDVLAIMIVGFIYFCMTVG